jgi:hypothetical protein
MKVKPNDLLESSKVSPTGSDGAQHIHRSATHVLRTIDLQTICLLTISYRSYIVLGGSISGTTMSLRKSPTLTPARLAAKRRNALKSTGPRTAWGKTWSRMNGLRSGSRSRFYRDLWLALSDAPPCAVDRTARAILTPALASHPLFSEAVDLFRQAEIEVVCESRWARLRRSQRKKMLNNDDRSLNVL